MKNLAIILSVHIEVIIKSLNWVKIFIVIEIISN